MQYFFNKKINGKNIKKYEINVDINQKVVYNFSMNENIEIFNFLSILNANLGNFYKSTGHNPLPKNFLPKKSDFQELLILGQMKATPTPSFIYEDKKAIKKFFKNNYKNSLKLAHHPEYYDKFSPKFAQKLEVYFGLRAILSKIKLDNFKNLSFDETESYQEIYNIDPVLGEKMTALFEKSVDIDSIFENLEENYHLSYGEKLKLIEKKESKKKKKTLTAVNVKQNQKTRKNVEKIAKNTKKSENKQKIIEVKTKIRNDRATKNKE